MEKTCNNCGSIYELDYTRIPVRDKDSLLCEVCGNEYYSWNEAKIWSDKLIERKENHLKKEKEL